MALERRLVIETVERAAVLGLLGGGRHVPAALPSVLVRHHWRLDHGVWLNEGGARSQSVTCVKSTGFIVKYQVARWVYVAVSVGQ